MRKIFPADELARDERFVRAHDQWSGFNDPRSPAATASSGRGATAASRPRAPTRPMRPAR